MCAGYVCKSAEHKINLWLPEALTRLERQPRPTDTATQHQQQPSSPVPLRTVSLPASPPVSRRCAPYTPVHAPRFAGSEFGCVKALAVLDGWAATGAPLG